MRAKIAFLDQTGQLGGAEVALVNLLAALDRERWHPTAVLGSDGPLRGWLVKDGVPVEVLRLPAVLSRVRQGTFDLALVNPYRAAVAVAYIVRLARLLRRLQVDLIHVNSLKLGFLGGLAGRIAGIPIVWQVHSVIAEPIMRKRTVQLVQFMIGCLPDMVICNSRATAEALGQRIGKVTVVPCGVQTDLFRPNAHANEVSRIGMVARFAPIKGQHVFLDAADRIGARYESARFVLAGKALFGEDGYEAKIRERAAMGSLAGRIELPGFVADVPSLLQTLDVVVHPSTQPEGFGQVVAEAMLAGKPVIASSTGGTAEIIEDGVTGRLVPPGDSEALAEAIAELLSNPSAAHEMGRRAREVALERYDIRKTTRAIEGVYERVLARP